MMQKGQGSLEYLIIIAAVLAIAAIVVLFLTGAFQGISSDVTACKSAAARCATEQVTSAGATCSYCLAECTDAAGNPIGVSSDTALYNTTADACAAGAPNYIVSG